MKRPFADRPMRSLSLLTAVVLVLSAASANAAVIPGFPAIGLDQGGNQGPRILITFNPDGSATVTNTGNPTYDGVEDTYVGVINHSSVLISQITLSGPNIFGFDGDGIVTSVSGGANPGVTGNAFDTSGPFNSGGYGGPNAYFTSLNLLTLPSASGPGLVHFINPIAPGDQSFFGLEGSPAVDAIVVPPLAPTVPEPSTFAIFGMMLALGAGCFFMQRRRVVVPASVV